MQTPEINNKNIWEERAHKLKKENIQIKKALEKKLLDEIDTIYKIEKMINKIDETYNKITEKKPTIRELWNQKLNEIHEKNQRNKYEKQTLKQIRKYNQG